jgi:Family of unknown function (DUF5994)
MTSPGITDPSLAVRIEPAPDEARLELFAPETDHPTTLDGAWWPHLGWFREIDPHLVGLRTSDDKRVEVLVIPPDTDAGTAARAMTLATTHRNLLSPTAVLDQAHGSEPLAADPEVTS